MLRMAPGLVVRSLCLLVLLAGGPTGPLGLAHLAEGDDPACEIGVPGSDVSALSAGHLGKGARGDHCATCHSLQALRWHPTATVSVAFASLVQLAVLHAGDLAVRAADVAQVPARAPPTA